MNTIISLLLASALVTTACAGNSGADSDMATTTIVETTTTVPATTIATSVPTSTTLSSEELFTSQANAICDEAGEQIRALGFVTEAQFREVEESGTYQEMADYMQGVSNIVVAAQDELAELVLPPENAEMFEEFLSAVDDLVEVMLGYVAALGEEDLTGWEDILGIGHSAEAKVASRALDGGFSRCSQLGVP